MEIYFIGVYVYFILLPMIIVLSDKNINKGELIGSIFLGIFSWVLVVVAIFDIAIKIIKKIKNEK